MNVLQENTSPYLHKNTSPALQAQDFHNTELGLLPKGWEVISLLETSTLKARIGWQGLTTAEYLERGDYYLVTGTDFFNGKIKWETCHYVDTHRYNQDKNIQVKNGDVLVTKDGTIGKVAYVEELNGKATLNSGVFVVRPKNNAYLPKYFFYVLCSSYFDTFLKQLTAGSTIVHLYQKDFVNFKFPLPPLPEQARIAEILQDQDALISRQEETIDKQKALKQATMQALLQPKEGWEVRRLGDIAEFYSGGTPSTSVREYYGGNIFWITSSDLNKTNIYDVEGKITEKGYQNSSAKMVKAGTLLLALYGATAGVTAINHIAEAAINQAVLAILPLKDVTKYLFYYLSNEKSRIINIYTQGGQANLSGQIIKDLLIPLPTLEEQTRIATILSDMDAEAEAMEAELMKLKAIKEGLMQELLTGRKRVKG